MSDKKEELIVFEDEKHILLDHEYDGIKELNHPLPNWWVVTFVLTIVFGVPYWAAHTFFGAQSINDELAADWEIVQSQQAAFDEKQGKFSEEKYNAYIAANSTRVDKIGKKTYKRKCRACHGAEGEGGVGPNLTDNFWIHGDGSLATVYNTINKGVVDKGMQAWGPTLGEEKMFAVLKYVMEFKGTNPANPKEAQGQEYP